MRKATTNVAGLISILTFVLAFLSARAEAGQHPAWPNAPLEPSVRQLSAPTPTAVGTASCGDYRACMSSGVIALRGHNWGAAFEDFQVASSLDPSEPDAWVGLGLTDLPLGRDTDLPTAWDNVLRLGGPVGFGVWYELPSQIEKGMFTLSAGEISFVNERREKVFSVPPAQVVALGAGKAQNRASFRLRVAGKDLSFDFLPVGLACQRVPSVQCPPQGITQQLTVGNDVTQTIPQLASGSLAHPPQPSAPATGVPASAPVSISPCAQAADLNYSILLSGRLYKVKGLGASGGNQVCVFFDEIGNPVTDSSLLLPLATGAWTRENIVASSATRSEISTKKIALEDMIGTSQALQGYEAIQDVLARAMAEAVEAAVTGGASLTAAVPKLTGGILRTELMNAPRTLFTVVAQIGLQRSLDTYKQLETILPPANAVALNANNLGQVKLLYTQAQWLDLPNEALASALMPTSAIELTNQALQSVVSELIPGLPSQTEAITLGQLWNLQKTLAEAGKGLPALQKHSENLDLVIRFSKANGRKIDTWATAAAQACGSGGAVGPPQGMRFAYANSDGTALLSAPTASGTNTPIGKPNQFDAAICSDNLALSVSFDRHQEGAPNDNGRDWAQNFEQHAGDRFRVSNGRAPADGSCLLTQRAFLSGKRPLRIKKESKAMPCESQTVSQLAAREKRGVHFCRRFATLEPDGQLLVIEFDPQGNDLLAGVVLKTATQTLMDGLPAKYGQGNGWREDDQGHLFDYSNQNAPFLDTEVGSVFSPLFAFQDPATGAVELGISWTGEEGIDLMLLSSSRGELVEVAKGYRYSAPI